MDIFEWKRKYKNIYILRFEDGSVVIFKLLKWGEFKSYRETIINTPNLLFEAKEDIFNQCVLDTNYPHKRSGDNLNIVPETLPAGVIDTVASLIIAQSGAMSADNFFTDLAIRRESAPYEFEERVLSLLANLFKYSKSEFDELHWIDIIGLVSQYELIATGQVPNIPIEPLVPEVAQYINFDNENKSYKDL